MCSYLIEATGTNFYFSMDGKMHKSRRWEEKHKDGFNSVLRMQG